MDKKKVIFIVGSTAIGKTALAIKLADKIKGEIISADSMQAYRGMDVLSQKPTKIQRRRVPHHLVGFLNPRNEYSAAEFSKKAKKTIKTITKKGRIPIVVGGSGLYVRALIDGIFPSKGKSEKIRRKLETLAEKNGPQALHKKLKKIDSASARKIHPHDLKRIIRALEIYEIENKTKTSLQKKAKGIKAKYDVMIFGLTMERDKLYERINKRVDLMFRKGVVREVKNFLGQDLSITSRQALGIRQIEGYLSKLYGIDRAKDLLKRDTRRFAKRQLTWFRPDKGITWLDIDKMDEAEAIGAIVQTAGVASGAIASS